MMFDIMKYFSREAKEFASSLLYYQRNEKDQPRYQGKCAIDYMLEVDGYGQFSDVSPFTVANLLGKFPEDDWEKILVGSNTFIVAFDNGKVYNYKKAFLEE